MYRFFRIHFLSAAFALLTAAGCAPSLRAPLFEAVNDPRIKNFDATRFVKEQLDLADAKVIDAASHTAMRDGFEMYVCFESALPEETVITKTRCQRSHSGEITPKTSWASGNGCFLYYPTRATVREAAANDRFWKHLSARLKKADRYHGLSGIKGYMVTLYVEERGGGVRRYHYVAMRAIT
jgi:hypothetical protein